MKVYHQPFGTHKGIEYEEIWIENGDVTVTFSNLGARINRWFIKQEGDVRHLILGANDASEAFSKAHYYYGSTIIPVAGRITKGQVALKGQHLQLDRNEGDHHLHGGFTQPALLKFDYRIHSSDEAVAIEFSTQLKDKVAGYPGNRIFKIKHTYTKDNLWQIDYHFTTDKTTLFNPTNHVYFNLDDPRKNTILNHQLKINADNYLPIQPQGVPVGYIQDVTETSFDFRQMKPIKDSVLSDDPQTQIKEGIDHPFVLNGEKPNLTLMSESGDVAINMSTSAKGVVIYTSNDVNEKETIWQAPLNKYQGVAIEAQDLPDAPTYPEFGCIEYSPDQPFSSTTSYQLIMK